MTMARKSTSTKTEKGPQPMDPNARESTNGSVPVSGERVAYAVQTLVNEVHTLFPDVPVEYSNRNNFNTALAVTFDLTMMDGGDSVVFNNLLSTLDGDPRVAEVICADFDQAFVAMHPSLRTQDIRDPFNLVAAYEVLTEDEA